MCAFLECDQGFSTILITLRLTHSLLSRKNMVVGTFNIQTIYVGFILLFDNTSQISLFCKKWKQFFLIYFETLNSNLPPGKFHQVEFCRYCKLAKAIITSKLVRNY